MTLATDQKSDTEGLSAHSRAMLALRDQVLDCWEAQLRAKVAEANQVSTPILINTLPAFYDNIAEAITPSYPRAHGAAHTTSMSAHGGERARMTPFRADQIVHEYQLFRDAIATVAQRNGLQLTPEEWRVIVRSIDVAVRDAIREFASIHEGIRERLAATLSHDMRNPLSVIASGAQLIALTPDLDTARRTAAKIHNASNRLVQMVIQLVDALTVDRGVTLPLSLSQFDIKNLVTALAQELNPGWADKIEIAVEPVLGYWCKSSLLRALENLVTNAIKYGDGARVAIKAEAVHGRLILSVHNTGNPIADGQRERIFEYLKRDPGSNGSDGWGIGLPFVRAVAEGHGGSIALDSSAATCTTFIIDIPVDCRPYVKPA